MKLAMEENGLSRAEAEKLFFGVNPESLDD